MAESAQTTHREATPFERALLQRRRRAAEPLWREALGERLRGLRHERGDTLDETAERAGISMQYLSEIERGRKEPSSEMIAAVAGALDVTLLDLTLSVAESLQEPTRTRGSASALALAA
ncbi:MULTISPECIES: helix-turn-helix domain-containing protein [Janibacter]|uniref:DNA-binding transcriptional regulator, XRE-family HTH domain n=1 Tax=Janibacter indicus TaxID=857417 RepID=A0A1W2C3L9_9MICO|nr:MULTISPECIES: helix-turn-helix transcriptional regulator [Janibacter]QNF95580.1 helix-turn-helix transcriptional regulator [Janibacter sp. YB324]SMC79740.1 DNA-binding transcriptional regulator, XRE-family HTH domain [Janibacter indicus]